MYNRLHTISACVRRTDRQTEEQTSCHAIVRAMHTRRAVKTDKHAKIQRIRRVCKGGYRRIIYADCAGEF